jgi:hypothetical protein
MGMGMALSHKRPQLANLVVFCQLQWLLCVLLKSDTDASILDGVKIVQKSKQRSIENKAENQNKYFSAEQF